MNRFWSKVKVGPANECWEWIAAKTKCGYGDFFYRSPNIRINAHRFSWQLHHGPIPAGKLICHTCDNRSCVNPAHLFLGTVKDNNNDRTRKNRTQHKLSIAEVSYIKQSDEPQKLLAKKFRVNQSSISRIKTGFHWARIK